MAETGETLPRSGDAGHTNEPGWDALIAEAATRPRPMFEAQTFHRGPWRSASSPVCVKCSDGLFRVLKGKQAGGRMLFNDQVIARLAQKCGAPVPAPALVTLSAAFISAEPRLSHMPPGVCHASAFLDEHTDREGVGHTTLSENRPRFARLAILYGWAHASDHQQIYPNRPPPLVTSVDHGHFIGNGNPNWTPDMLAKRGPAHADQHIESGAALTRQELIDAALPLQEITAADLADCIGYAPTEWDVPPADRIAFARYMWSRRSDLIAAYRAPAAAVPMAESAGE